METIGYIGSIFLTINAIPELFRTITDKRCHIGWPMLLLWFIGEIFMTTYAIMLWNIPLMMNYIFNFIVVVVMLAYKMKHFYRKKMKISVKIDPWDTWSMDVTLAHIILPMLKQLKETKHGAPHVDDEDVPEHLRKSAAPPTENDWDTDDNYFKRWDWVMDEMIFAFESKQNCTWTEKYVNQVRIINGLRLFGKYYEGLWD